MKTEAKGNFVASALALAGALCISTAVFAQQTQLNDPPTAAAKRVLDKPLTAAQQQAAAAQGSSFGQDGINQASTQTLDMDTTAGPKKAGCTRVNGKCVDNEEMIGRGYSQERVDRAGQADGKMANLKQLYDDESKKTTADDGVVGSAYRTTEDAAEAKVVGRRAVAETNWAPTRGALEQGNNGNAMGMGFEQCSTTTTVIPGTNTDAYLKEQNVCEEVTLPSGGDLCTRERVVTTTQPMETKSLEQYLGLNGGQNETFCQRTTQIEDYQVEVANSKIGTLGFSNETGGLVCTRNRWAEMVNTPYDKEKTASLGVNTETGGLSATRWLEPSNSQDIQAQQMTADLPIDNQAGGNLCKRTAWPENTSTPTSGTKSGLLNVNGESGGLSCSRTVWPESSTSSTGVSQDATLSVDQQPVGGNLCRREVWPTTASGTTGGTKNATLSIANESAGLICSRIIQPGTTTSTGTGTKDVVASVNNETGGLSCQRWRNVQQNTGSPVTTSSYTYTKVTRANQGTGPWYTVTDLSAFVPAGTTSLANFQMVKSSTSTFTYEFVVTDPPTAANGWKVTVRTASYDCEVDTSSGCTQANTNGIGNKLLEVAGINTAVAAPMCPVYCGVGTNTAYFTFTPMLSSKTFSIVESGNCADTGTAYCPAVWSCTTQAPTTINGIAVSAAEVGALGALYPGAPSACTNSQLARTCGGTSQTSNTFSIADQLQAGTTSISGFQAVIQNPQNGVSRVITQVPSAANNWVAIIRIDRTDYSYTPNPVQLRLSWNTSYTQATASVVDSGDCSGTGSTNCPAVWNCTRYAPYTGVSTTTANQFAPLYPGAPSNCGQAEKTRSCSGNGTQTNQISIAADLAPNTTSISNFAFTVNNPQSGVTVALTQTPSAANNWIAIFTVSRSDWSYWPSNPQITMTWNNNTSSTSVSTKDTGNCAATGTANCPAAWTCTTNAPTTINGITVTTAMAASVAPLFPGASSSCAVGSLDKTCSGSAAVGTSVDVSSRMPAGTTAINSFAFSVLNPQTGVTVALSQTPSAANGWIARFVVTRSNWSYVPAQPNIRMTWNATQPSTTLSVRDTGDCADPGSTVCPTKWTCPHPATYTVNGIAVTAAMAGTQAPLYPGASSSCVEAALSRVCSGSSTVGTSLSIADKIPAGVTTISNFGFAVSNPQAGVTVTLVSAPTYANGWMATFNVTRTNVASPPQQPSVTMTWNMSVPGTSMSVKDTGDCAASGTANCPAVWSCPKVAPQTINGITVTAAMAAQVAPLYSGASSSCVEASLDKACSGSAATQTSISIASRLPAGTSSIQNFRFTVNNPQSGVTVTLTQTPAAANNWLAIFKVARTDFSAAKVNPNITLQWDAVIPTVTLAVMENGNVNDPGSAACPTAWTCTATAPTTVNGIVITAANAATKAPLYPGAANECVRAELNRVCSGNATMGTTVGIGELIPAGVHAIENFAFTVLNPQPGIWVTLVTAPTEANGWMAYFKVSRTSWSYTPVAPNIKITFRVQVPEPKLTVQDTGDCSDPGSVACPTKWTCSQTAPTTINGINVTAEMVQSLPLLFPNASNLCTQGKLSRVCDGTGMSTSQISIADKIAPDVDSIVNFTWAVTNPQPALTVSIVTAPTKANGWVATFKVVRDYSVSGTPVAPSVELKWGVMETRHRAVMVSTGDCTERTAALEPASGTLDASPNASIASLALNAVVASAVAQTMPAGDSCQVQWTCTQSMPATINGIPVTQAMLDERGPLYPGDGPPPSCLAADYQRVCGGTGASRTEISIKPLLRPDTTQIYNYTWTVTEPGSGVSVSSVQVPSAANDWVAIFEVTRTNWSVTPTAPKVKLQWDQGGEYQHDFEIKDTGDCSAGQDDEFCKVKWTCEDEAPPPPPPTEGPLISHTTTGWIPGARAIWGEPMDKEIVFSDSYFPAGTAYIRNFSYVVRYDKATCTARIWGDLTPDHRSVTAMTTSTKSGTSCQPEFQFQWDNYAAIPATAALTPTQSFLKSVALVGNAILPKAMAVICADCDTGGGGGVDTGDLTDQPPLFPGDGPPATCMKAKKTLDCSATYTGKECTTNSEGEEVCVDQPPTDRPDTCAEYRDDPQCQLIREECAEGGMSTSGWCYVKSRLYECKRPVPGGAADPVIHEERTCTNPAAAGTTLPALCQDGSCSNAQTTDTEVGMGGPGAKMMIVQHVMNDYVPAPSSGGGTGGGSGPTPTDPTVPQQQASLNVKSGPSAAEAFGNALVSAAGVGTAYAQTMPDPWAVPDDGSTDQDPTDGTGGVTGSSFSGINITFFPGKSLDCMKALGGLLNCCKKKPPQDQAPKLWDYIKKNLTQANNAIGREEEADDDGSGFLKLIQGASHFDLMKQFTSNLDSLMGGGQGGPTNTDTTMTKSYKDFFDFEKMEVKPKLAWYCDNSEFELAVGQQTGTCTHLGSFCQTKVLGHCIIKKDRYCCFNSPVTRIIRESLNQSGVAPLGSAKHPNCGGITAEQVSKINADQVDTSEIEGRMAQGKFNIDIAALQGMSSADIQSLLDGANSLIGDPTRQNPSTRASTNVGQTDPNGAYSSILGSQSGYKPPATPVEATAGEVGMDVLERDYARGVLLPIKVRRTGSKGAVTVRIWTEDGTATAPAHYVAVNQTLGWADGQTGEQKVVIRTVALDASQKPIARQNFKVRIEIVSGDATLSGNSTATIWLEEEK